MLKVNTKNIIIKKKTKQHKTSIIGYTCNRDIKNIENRDKNEMLLAYKVWQNCRVFKKTREMARSLTL